MCAVHWEANGVELDDVLGVEDDVGDTPLALR